jgi:squalene cyclase
VQFGVRYLLETQQADGSWTEEFYTGTGFPSVFYLKYHLYPQYFPLMALAKYQAHVRGHVKTAATVHGAAHRNGKPVAR